MTEQTQKRTLNVLIIAVTLACVFFIVAILLEP